MWVQAKNKMTNSDTSRHDDGSESGNPPGLAPDILDQLFDVPPERLVGKGHPAGDFLEAYDWIVVDEEVDRLRIDAHLPAQVLNPRGQLFGGFTPTYVDLVSLHANRAGPDRNAPDRPRFWTATINMRVDYFEPITGPRFVIEAIVENRRGQTSLVATRMYQDGVLATYAITTMRLLGEPQE